MCNSDFVQRFSCLKLKGIQDPATDRTQKPCACRLLNVITYVLLTYLLAIKDRHHHQQQKDEENDADNSPPRTPPKLFRPYLDADDSPKLASRVQDDEGPLLTAGTVSSASVPVGGGTETTSMGCSSPRVTSVSLVSTRKYGCDLCGRMFSRSNTLVTHRVCTAVLRCFVVLYAIYLIINYSFSAYLCT